MMAQINCKATYSRVLYLIHSQHLCNYTSGSFSCVLLPNVSSACLWLGPRIIKCIISPSCNCRWAESTDDGQLSENVGGINDELISIPRVHCVVVWKLVCAEKVSEYSAFVIVNKHNSGWTESMSLRGSLCFKGSFSWVSDWHDEVVVCHSCLAKPAKGAWLNSNFSSPKRSEAI